VHARKKRKPCFQDDHDDGKKRGQIESRVAENVIQNALQCYPPQHLAHAVPLRALTVGEPGRPVV
jgi:hypothetical protein